MLMHKLMNALFFVAICGSVDPLLGQTGSGQDSVRRIEVTARRYSFQPGEVTLKRGQPVVLLLKSADTAHGIRFRELNLETKVSKGGTTELRFTPEKVGEFVGHCAVFCGSGHGSMALTLHVVE
jgi:cytochrome c oxidase subunit II